MTRERTKKKRTPRVEPGATTPPTGSTASGNEPWPMPKSGELELVAPGSFEVFVRWEHYATDDYQLVGSSADKETAFEAARICMKRGAQKVFVVEQLAWGITYGDHVQELDDLKLRLKTALIERDEARAQLQAIGRKAFWAAKPSPATNAIDPSAQPPGTPTPREKKSS